MAAQTFAETTRVGLFGTRYEKKVSLSSATTSDEILVPAGVKGVNCTISFANTATAKLQYTNSTLADVDAGSAVWIDKASEGSSNVALYLDACTAFRLNVTAWTSGAVTLSAVAQ